MTNREVRDLIVNREGRLCIRLYRRADGTVLTKDCPIGLRAIQKRISGFASATFATVVSLFSVSYGLSSPLKVLHVPLANAAQEREGELAGIVLDPNGAVIPGARLKISKDKQKSVRMVESNADGVFSIKNLEEGIYKLESEVPRFKKAIHQNIELRGGKKTEIRIMMEPAGESVTVGIFYDEPLIDVTSPGITTIITKRKIDSIPH